MRQFLRQFISFLLIALMVMGPAQQAFAQELSDSEKAEFKDLTGQAQKAFEAEKYEDAATLFLKAYEIKPVSNILYNVARIYEKAGNMENALTYYEEFVKSPNVELEPRQDALDRIKTLREVLALDAPTEENTQDPDPEPKPVASPDYTLAYVFWGVGAASLATSLVFGILSSSKFSDFEDANDLETKRDAANSGETFALVADITLISGVVFAALGTVFFFTAGPSDSEGVAIAPIIGPDRVGMGMSFDF